MTHLAFTFQPTYVIDFSLLTPEKLPENLPFGFSVEHNTTNIKISEIQPCLISDMQQKLQL